MDWKIKEAVSFHGFLGLPVHGRRRKFICQKKLVARKGFGPSTLATILSQKTCRTQNVILDDYGENAGDC